MSDPPPHDEDRWVGPDAGGRRGDETRGAAGRRACCCEHVYEGSRRATRRGLGGGNRCAEEGRGILKHINSGRTMTGARPAHPPGPCDREQAGYGNAFSAAPRVRRPRAPSYICAHDRPQVQRMFRRANAHGIRLFHHSYSTSKFTAATCHRHRTPFNASSQGPWALQTVSCQARQQAWRPRCCWRRKSTQARPPRNPRRARSEQRFPLFATRARTHC